MLAIAIVAWSPVKGTEGARQDRPAVEAWLGSFAAGAERVTIAWGAGGLTLHLGNVVLRVDGAWHETVPTFSVRHRATWLADRQVIAIDEQHNRGAHWRHELRLEPDGQRLQKVVLSPTGTGERVQRIYARMR